VEARSFQKRLPFERFARVTVVNRERSGQRLGGLRQVAHVGAIPGLRYDDDSGRAVVNYAQEPISES
jgi:hypothetical protein